MREIISTLKILASIGNVLFILWILYNGINEGFPGTALEVISYIVLIGLLDVNTILLLGARKWH